MEASQTNQTNQTDGTSAMLSGKVNEPIVLDSSPDHIFHARRKNGSGELPIPFLFKCAGMLAPYSF